MLRREPLDGAPDAAKATSTLAWSWNELRQTPE